MAAHTHTHIRVPSSHQVLALLRTFTSRLELDHQLAAGADPTASPALARRADILCRERVRHRIADGLERAVMDAILPPRECGAAVPVQRKAVRGAAQELLRLADALRADPGPPVRAIAVASVLLSDGAGPLFSPRPRETLREIAFRAAFHAEAN